MDIRNYFSVLSTKSSSSSNQPPTSAKKRSKTINSSDEVVIPDTPVPKKRKEKLFKKRKIIVSSDSEEETNFMPKAVTKEKPPKQALKPVKAADIFGTEPVKQTKVPDRPKLSNLQTNNKESNTTRKGKKKVLAKEIFEDKKFQETLLDLDDDFLSENLDQLDESIKEAENQLHNKTVEKTVELPTQSNTTKPEIVELQPPQVSVKRTDQNCKINSNVSKADGKTPTVKRKLEEYDSEADMNRHEKKRHSAILYQKYLNRSGPAHHGTKGIPEGKPDCLKKLCFIRTGVLDSLDNDEFESLIKNHGGKVVHSVSKKVNYVVAGEDPGPAKLEKASSLGIKVISEDDVLDLIRTKSGLNINDVKEPKSLDQLIDASSHVTNSTTNDSASKSKLPSKLNGSMILKDYKSKNSNEFCGARLPTKNLSTEVNDSKKTINDSSVGSRVNGYTQKEKINSSIKEANSSQAPMKLSKIESDISKSHDYVPWTEKYKPTNIKSIIGQQGDKSNVKRLITWLGNWFKSHSGSNKPKLIKPTPWAKNDDGSYYKAALLSGPPGVGKTTTAHLVAKELGLDVVECNASDTRSKRLLQEGLSQLLSSKSLAGFLKDGSSPTHKHILLMDEVDGMAGNEDRGGVQELINLIKNSNIPIICMCNDKNHPKMRSLVNYCYDLRFSKPRLEQIKGAMMSVCFKEGIDITPNALNEVIIGAGMDIRQILTNLSVWSAGEKSLSSETAGKEAKSAAKDVPLGQWDVCHKVFSENEHKNMSLSDRSRLFYHDYSLAPLFVQENYLKVTPHAPREETLKRFSAAADSISMGDLIDKQIRSSNNWSLLDVQAMCASVIPGYQLRGHIGGQIDFPSWLGKNSKKNKFNRLVSEIQAHMRTSISGSRSAVNLDYITHLRNNIAKPLMTGASGIGVALEVMRSYNLLREDLDGIMELSQWPKQKDPMNLVDSKVKAAFTRAYNKAAILPYSVQTSAVKKKGSTTKQTDEIALDNYGEEDDDGSSPEDNDDVTNDAMIKTKKTGGNNSKKDSQSKPTSSKCGTARGSGTRGRKKN